MRAVKKERYRIVYRFISCVLAVKFCDKMHLVRLSFAQCYSLPYNIFNSCYDYQSTGCFSFLLDIVLMSY